jgi:hypothetical protein
MCLLLNCSVEDLFSWKSEDKTGIYKDHVIQKLKRGQRKGNITNSLKQLPLDKLDEVRNYIDQGCKGQKVELKLPQPLTTHG